MPAGVEHLWDVENYSADDVRAVAVQPGLEICLFDYSQMQLRPVEPEAEPQALVVNVAGILALLVAKGWKIGERWEQGVDAFPEVAKDIVDVYRLLRAARIDELRINLIALPKNAKIQEVVRKGAEYLLQTCGRDRPGIQLLRRIIGSGSEAEIIAASLEVLITEFHELVFATFF